jgi:hypothetical protein
LHASFANDGSYTVALQQQWDVFGEAEAGGRSDRRNVVFPWTWLADGGGTVEGDIAGAAQVERRLQAFLEYLVLKTLAPGEDQTTQKYCIAQLERPCGSIGQRQLQMHFTHA